MPLAQGDVFRTISSLSRHWGRVELVRVARRFTVPGRRASGRFAARHPPLLHPITGFIGGVLPLVISSIENLLTPPVRSLTAALGGWHWRLVLTARHDRVLLAQSWEVWLLWLTMRKPAFVACSGWAARGSGVLPLRGLSVALAMSNRWTGVGSVQESCWAAACAASIVSPLRTVAASATDVTNLSYLSVTSATAPSVRIVPSSTQMARSHTLLTIPTE